MKTMKAKKDNLSKAQAMVEFALILPVLLMLTMGLLEAGRLMVMYSGVITASREAVRYGLATGDNGSGTPQAQDCVGIRETAKQMAFLSNVQDSDITIEYDHGPGTSVAATCSGTTTSFEPTTGDRIRVTVTVHYVPVVPLIPLPAKDLTATTAHSYVGQVNVPKP